MEDTQNGRFGGRVHTRWPPEPNGYLHVGHAKAMCMDFGLAQEFGGKCNLRFDDTNPVKEDVEYVDAIKEDIHWLGFDWQEREFYASDYFDQLYDFAVQLIRKAKAYVDDLSADAIRGTAAPSPSPAGQPLAQPFRGREPRSLRPDEGRRVSRWRVRAPGQDRHGPANMNMRDPVMYRILNQPPHHRTGNQWHIYPMYDFAHGQCRFP